MTKETEISENVLAAIKTNRKIDAIKLLREEQNLDLKAAKDIVDTYIAKNPNLAISQSRQGSFSITPLLLAAVVTTALYFAYKALS
jgi:hypothetical protein